MLDMFRRYFIANRAPILSVRRPLRYGRGCIRCRCGNADGFYLGRWQVMWRIPYSKVWAFDGRRWVPVYTIPNPADAEGGKG